VKNSDATSFSELVRLWQQFGPFCADFRAVTKRYEMPQNMSLGPKDWIGRFHCENCKCNFV
jgi:hypothetical protein